MPIIEIGPMGVQPGKDVMNPSTDAGQITLNTWKTVTSNALGPARVYWGLEHAEPDQFWAFFEWKSVEHHEEFAKKFGIDAVKDLPKVFTQGAFTKHLDMAPWPMGSDGALDDKVTEMMMAYFPANFSADEKQAVSWRYREFLERSHFSHWHPSPVSYGWGMENDFPVPGRDGLKGLMFVALIGWESMDACRRDRQNEDILNEHDHLLRDLKFLELKFIHVECQSLETALCRII